MIGQSSIFATYKDLILDAVSTFQQSDYATMFH